jgi:Cu(I)/Ag(I) efflux system protein CusF
VKTLVIAAALVLNAVTAAHSTTHNTIVSNGTQQSTHKAVGVVKKIDPREGKVMVTHEAIKSLEWPAMTMSFTVQDKTVLDKLTPGRKIEFEFQQRGKDYVIVRAK